MRCPACNGAMKLIGILGVLRHMTCRMCGLSVHEPIPDVEGDLPCGGDHLAHEDCMICHVCGACREDLDEEDVCVDCLEVE